MNRRAVPWLLLAGVVGTEIAYPLTAGATRSRLVVATVLIGCLLSVWHAAATRGARAALTLVAVTGGGGLAVEVLGVATGFPFGRYAYSGDLGLRLADVPLIIPLAWTWMAWPAWLAATRLIPRATRPTAARTTAPRTATARTATTRTAARVALAAAGLAGWDLFLDPQMVAEGYWTWADPHPALPGVPDVPIGNHLGWYAVALLMMTALAITRSGAHGTADDGPGATRDRPVHALFLWTYASSILAHAAFLGLPASAGWGGLGMGVAAVPLAIALTVGRIVARSRPGIRSRS